MNKRQRTANNNNEQPNKETNKHTYKQASKRPNKQKKKHRRAHTYEEQLTANVTYVKGELTRVQFSLSWTFM